MFDHVPMWPDFYIEPYDQQTNIWRVSTCTMRPPVVNGRGQIFSVFISSDKPEDARAHLDFAYLKAHPNGCPKTH